VIAIAGATSQTQRPDRELNRIDNFYRKAPLAVAGGALRVPSGFLA
jgi:hypothetical protein